MMPPVDDVQGMLHVVACVIVSCITSLYQVRNMGSVRRGRRGRGRGGRRGRRGGRGRRQRQATTAHLMSFYLRLGAAACIVVGYFAVGVRQCVKTNTVVIPKWMDHWSIVLCPCCALLLLLLSIMLHCCQEQDEEGEDDEGKEEEEEEEEGEEEGEDNEGEKHGCERKKKEKEEAGCCSSSATAPSTLILISFVQLFMFLHRPQRIFGLCKIFLSVTFLRDVLKSSTSTTTTTKTTTATTTTTNTTTTKKKKEEEQEFDQTVYIPDILAYVCLGQCCFFSLGNSHTIGTADFAGAYTGATEFGKTTIGFIAWSMIFTGPLVSYAGALSHLLKVVEEEEDDNDDNNVGAWMMMMTVLSYRLAVLTVSSFATFSFQHHLFVWSVFAPKFVYEVGQTFVVVVFFFIFFAWKSLQNAALRRTKSKKVTKKIV